MQVVKKKKGELNVKKEKKDGGRGHMRDAEINDLRSINN